MESAVIPSSWLSWAATWSAAVLVAVKGELAAQGIAVDAATEAEVKAGRAGLCAAEFQERRMKNGCLPTCLL